MMMMMIALASQNYCFLAVEMIHRLVGPLARRRGLRCLSSLAKGIDSTTKALLSGDGSGNNLMNLHLHIRDHVSAMDASNIANVLFWSGKQKVRLNEETIRMLADQLANKKIKVNKILVSKMLYGFRSHRQNSASVVYFIKILTAKIVRSPALVLDGQGVGNSLYGLQGLTCESNEVRALVGELCHHVDNCTSEMKCQEISNSLYGLQNMSSSMDEVKALLKSLTYRIKSSSDPFSAQAIGNCLYGMKNMNSDHPEVRELLNVLSEKISQSNALLSSQHIGNSFYGLRYMSSEEHEVCNILRCLTAKAKQQSGPMRVQEFGNAMYGLQRMDSSHAEVQEALVLFSGIIKRLNGFLDKQAIGNILYGMQSMSTDHKVVRDILSALMQLITTDDCAKSLKMNGQEICNAVYGMKQMNMMDSQVKDVLSFLRDQLHNCDDHVTPQVVSSILLGLQNKTCDDVIVQDILKLCSRIGKGSEAISIVNFGSCLYGMQCMSSDTKEVRDFLAALHSKLSFDQFELSDGVVCRSICNALYGLQCMDSTWVEVRQILGTLADRLRLYPSSSITAQGFGCAVYGLQLMTLEHSEVVAIYEVLCEKMSSSLQLDVRAIGNSFFGMISPLKTYCSNDSRQLVQKFILHLVSSAEILVNSVRSAMFRNEKVSIATQDLQDLWRSIELFSHFVDSEYISSDLKNRVLTLSASLSQCTPHSTVIATNTDDEKRDFMMRHDWQTRQIEERVQEQVKTILQDNPTVQISYNEMLYGFESDIVLRVSSVDRSLKLPDIVQNIEVDGISHMQPHRKKFCKLRDIYLEENYGIRISRIKLFDRKYTSDDDLHAAVLNHLHALQLFTIAQKTQHTFF